MDWLGLFGAILGIAGTVGAGSAVFYANSTRNTIGILKEENAAYEKQNSRLEKDLEVAVTRVTAAEEKVSFLENMVTQAPSIKELTQVMTAQNKQVTDSLGNVATELSRLITALEPKKRRK